MPIDFWDKDGKDQIKLYISDDWNCAYDFWFNGIAGIIELRDDLNRIIRKLDGENE